MLLAEFGREVRQELGPLPIANPTFAWTFLELTAHEPHDFGQWVVPIEWGTQPGYKLGDVIQVPNVGLHPTMIQSGFGCRCGYEWNGTASDSVSIMVDQLFKGRVWYYPREGTFGQTFVPQLGNALTGYTVTSATFEVTQSAAGVGLCGEVVWGAERAGAGSVCERCGNVLGATVLAIQGRVLIRGHNDCTKAEPRQLGELARLPGLIQTLHSLTSVPMLTSIRPEC